MAKTTGHYVTAATAGEQFKAFVPDPLPAQATLELKARHFELMENANWALVRLDGMTALLPDTPFLPLLLRPKGSPPLLPGRGHPIVFIRYLVI